MILVIATEHEQQVLSLLREVGEEPKAIGSVTRDKSQQEFVKLLNSDKAFY